MVRVLRCQAWEIHLKLSSAVVAKTGPCPPQPGIQTLNQSLLEKGPWRFEQRLGAEGVCGLPSVS